METLVEVNLLYDAYGALLTEKQRQVVEMHAMMDLSLSEIGEELGISRQGAMDALKRAVEALRGFEQKLHLVQQREALERLSRDESLTAQALRRGIQEILAVEGVDAGGI